MASKSCSNVAGRQWRAGGGGRGKITGWSRACSYLARARGAHFGGGAATVQDRLNSMAPLLASTRLWLARQLQSGI